MTSDFDELTDRRGTASMKWDVGPDELPLWVADMDFRTAPAITAALQRRAASGIFGYTDVPDEYRQAVVGWWQRRHHLELDPDWLTLTTGTVPAISSLVRTLSDPGDQVVLLTPVYNVFFACVRNSGREVSASPLIQDGTAGWGVDWADLERRLAEPTARLLIWCNPHNPTGTLWDAPTMRRVAELCARHEVRVISDEVHGDLTLPGHRYTPFASVSALARSLSVSCLAPTKAFNVAGLQTACTVVPDPDLRSRVRAGFNRDEIAEPNAFAVDATIAAFTGGEAWLDDLRGYLAENKRRAVARINEIPGLSAELSPATYLVWIDARELGRSSTELVERIRAATGLVLSDGAAFDPAAADHLRMNVACPRVRLDDALDRLAAGVASVR